MLSQAVRPSAHAAACAACAPTARRTAASLALPARHHLHPSYTAQTPATRSTAVQGHRRGQASFAQVGERVSEDQVEQDGEGEETVAAAEEKTAEPAEAVEANEEEAPVESAEDKEPVKEDEVPAQQEQEEQVSSSPAEQADEPSVGPTQSLLDLLNSITPPSTPEASTTSNESSPLSSSSPSSSLSADPSDIPPVPSIPIRLPNSFSSHTPPTAPPLPARGRNLPDGHPQLDDLFALRPAKRVRVPTAESPDSHRLVYSRAWEAAMGRLTRAFTKQQLLRLAGPDGLEVDVGRPEMRTATPGRKGKNWKSKKLVMMSKNELAQAILIVEFGLVHPDTVALNAKTGPQASEILTLSNRTLFLLLSPNSPTIPNIARKLGVKTSFRRDPATGLIQLLLKGNQKSMDAAKEEVQMVDELKTVEHEVLPLPCPPTVLRPEVYQSISRATKVFLEAAPSSPPPDSSSSQPPPTHSLSASALSPPSLLAASRLLHSAFTAHSHTLSTALAASLPSADTHPTTLALGLATRYAMTPVQPLVAPEAVRSGAATAFARVKALSVAAAPGGRGVSRSAFAAMLEHAPAPAPVDEPSPPAGLAGEDLAAWRDKMRLSSSSSSSSASSAPSMTRTGISAPASFSNSAYKVGETGILGLLKAPFTATGGEAEKTKVEVKARFGFVGWPLYPSASLPGGQSPSPPSGAAGDGGKPARSRGKHAAAAAAAAHAQRRAGMEPVLAGQWGFEKFREWVGFREGEGVRGVFVAAPPPNLLASTGVLTPLPSTFPSFSLSSTSLSTSPSTPSLLSRSLRRWVYTPLLHSLPSGERAQALQGGGRANERVVVEVEESGEGGPGSEELGREVRWVREARVDVMVPTGAVDAQFSMTQTEVLDEANSPFELLNNPKPNLPPLTLTHRGTTYMLDTDRRIRRTVLTPPSPSSPSSSDTAESAPAPASAPEPFAQVQEQWTALWPADSARGTDVFLAITPPRDGESASASASASESESEAAALTVEELQKSGTWRRGLEAVEEGCGYAAEEEERGN
ncbi:hypothetical protein JCM6882_008094 [Rhodosporidiobolus microsporus]